MLGYEFKTYLLGGREHLMYRERDIGDTEWTRRDFTFPDNLIFDGRRRRSARWRSITRQRTSDVLRR